MTSKEVAGLYRNLGVEAPQGIAAPDASKYRARKKEVNGHLFDSTGEAEAYRLLLHWHSIGAIQSLELQPAYVLQAKHRDATGKMHRAIVYRPDFRYLRDKCTFVVDFKGFRTPVYRIKIKLFLAKFPGIVFMEWDRAKLKEMC